MPTELQVFTSAVPDSQPTETTNAGSTTVGTVSELFIPKVDLSTTGHGDVTVCYVIDGGTSEAHPCDSS